MKSSSERKEYIAPPGSSTPQFRALELYLGVDGGGTKTRAVLLNTKNQVVGEGVAGPSNPLRVGVGQAATAIREAINEACTAASVRRADIVAAKIGLAGAKRKELRERMREALSGLGIESIEVLTDADIALFGATGGQPGIVVIAGTGSICCGVNARGKHGCAGGWGPLAGDEGSGSWIARRALQSVAHMTDGRGPETRLTELARTYFNVASAEDLSTAIYAPMMTNDRIAGFCRHVIEASRSGDRVAQEIIVAAGRELGLAVAAVVRQLKMERERFQVAYVGGVFVAGERILNSLRKEIEAVAPDCFLAPPQIPPAQAAAQMARERPRKLALAG